MGADPITSTLLAGIGAAAPIAGAAGPLLAPVAAAGAGVKMYADHQQSLLDDKQVADDKQFKADELTNTNNANAKAEAERRSYIKSKGRAASYLSNPGSQSASSIFRQQLI